MSSSNHPAIHSFQSISCPIGSHIPITTITVGNDEFNRIKSIIKRTVPQDTMDEHEEEDQDEPLILCWSSEVKHLFDFYQVVGGDIVFVNSEKPVCQ